MDAVQLERREKASWEGGNVGGYSLCCWGGGYGRRQMNKL